MSMPISEKNGSLSNVGVEIWRTLQISTPTFIIEPKKRKRMKNPEAIPAFIRKAGNPEKTPARNPVCCPADGCGRTMLLQTPLFRNALKRIRIGRRCVLRGVCNHGISLADGKGDCLIKKNSVKARTDYLKRGFVEIPDFPDNFSGD